MADLDERLREIARAAEPSIRLAGPEAARARGRRRRARQRAAIAAAATLTAAALTVGSWQLLPGDDSSRTLPAAPPAPRTPTTAAAQVPTSALLPPSALPFDAEMHWKTIRSTGQERSPLLDLSPTCRLDGPDPLAQRTRTYQSQKADRARHTINAYASEADAAKVFTTLEETLKKQCVSRSLKNTTGPSGASSEQPTVVTYSWHSSGAPRIAQVALMRSGTEVAVLQTKGLSSLADDYTDGPSTYCMSVSLWRLDPSASASPDPYRQNPEEAKRRC